MTSLNFDSFISENNQFKQIPIEMLMLYRNYELEPYKGKQLDAMVNSVKAYGILTPIIVRTIERGKKYEIIDP